MRIKITLKLEGKNQLLPLNYHYFLSAAIYNLLGFGKPEFGEFLHNKGYKVKNKNYKLFTFALRVQKFQIVEDFMKLTEPEAHLFVSSPLIDDFFTGIIIGSLKTQSIKIKSGHTFIEFSIKQIEKLPLPKFTSSMKFSMLSPLVLSTHVVKDGKLLQYYLRHYDDISVFNQVLNENLKNKFVALYDKEYFGEGIEFYWDENSLRKSENNNRRIRKKISIYSGRNKIDVIGNIAPFYLKGDVELIKLGYETGYGEKNSMGFGMAKVIN